MPIFNKKIKKIAHKLGLEIRRYQPENHLWIDSNKIKTIIDIGANIGQFAKYIHKIIPDASIYSFEPIKKCYNELIKNSASMNLHAFNFGLGEENSEVLFNVSSHDESSSMLEMANLHKEIYSFSKDHIQERIKLRTLDSFINEMELRKNILIKIDVQGYEDRVIRGGHEMFSKASIIITEINYQELYKKQTNFHEVYTLLSSLGFYFMGNLDQVSSPIDGKILYSNSLFMKK